MNDNPFSVINGGKTEGNPPNNEYVVTTLDGTEYFADGFAIFTSQHVAVMRYDGEIAIPVLLVPLDSVKVMELVDDEEDGAPF